MKPSFLIMTAVLVMLAGCSDPPNSRRPVTVVEPTPSPIPTTWFSPNSSFSECFQSRGPAARLDSLSAADSARTRDFRDSLGNLRKVEVIVDIGFGQQAVNTYYSDMATCEAEHINRNSNLADQYR
jgi:hypothetical protein